MGPEKDWAYYNVRYLNAILIEKFNFFSSTERLVKMGVNLKRVETLKKSRKF